MKALTIFFLTLLCFPIYSETLKIGYINTEQVVNNLTQYQKDFDIISSEFEPKKQKLLDLFEHIELLRIKITTISKSENKENLSIELSSLEDSFRKETEFWQESMNNKKIELLQEIEILINSTVNEIGISESYDLILYENVAFVSDKVDITRKVIQRIQKLSL